MAVENYHGVLATFKGRRRTFLDLGLYLPADSTLEGQGHV
jgi:hypothetical protein